MAVPLGIGNRFNEVDRALNTIKDALGVTVGWFSFIGRGSPLLTNILLIVIVGFHVHGALQDNSCPPVPSCECTVAFNGSINETWVRTVAGPPKPGSAHEYFREARGKWADVKWVVKDLWEGILAAIAKVMEWIHYWITPTPTPQPGPERNESGNGSGDNDDGSGPGSGSGPDSSGNGGFGGAGSENEGDTGSGEDNGSGSGGEGEGSESRGEGEGEGEGWNGAGAGEEGEGESKTSGSEGEEKQEQGGGGTEGGSEEQDGFRGNEGGGTGGNEEEQAKEQGGYGGGGSKEGAAGGDEGGAKCRTNPYKVAAMCAATVAFVQQLMEGMDAGIKVAATCACKM